MRTRAISIMTAITVSIVLAGASLSVAQPGWRFMQGPQPPWVSQPMPQEMGQPGWRFMRGPEPGYWMSQPMPQEMGQPGWRFMRGPEPPYWTGQPMPQQMSQPGWRFMRGPQEQYRWNYCPMCGAPLRAEPEAGWRGEGGMPHHSPYRALDKPLTEEDARSLAIDRLRNPNLRVGDIGEKEGRFEASIVTQETGQLVDTWIIDKNTGEVRSIY